MKAGGNCSMHYCDTVDECIVRLNQMWVNGCAEAQWNG